MRSRLSFVLIVVTMVGILSTATPAPGWDTYQSFLVGPDGNYATIAAALADLLAAPLTINEIKVQGGVTSYETLDFPASWTTDTIRLSGGWDASFATQSGDPTDTVIDGRFQDSVVDVFISGGTLHISGLSLVHGWSDFGGGIRVEPTISGGVRLENLAVHSNRAVNPDEAGGGGIHANLVDSTSLDIIDCDIHTNEANGLNIAFGAGIDIRSHGSSVFSITDTTIRNNEATSDWQMVGAGVSVDFYDSSDGTIADCAVESNTVVTSSGHGTVLGVGIHSSSGGNSTLRIERTRVTSNEVGFVTFHPQVGIFANFGDSVVTISDSIIADGRWCGLFLSSGEQSTIHATNLTVALNDTIGIFGDVNATSSINLSNSIVYSPTGTNLSISTGIVNQIGNVIGVDPEFVDIPDLDFRVEAGSVAVDAGVADPPGGLGIADIRGGMRTLGTAPDAGAYEGTINLTFSDGFELQGTGHWSWVIEN